MDELETALTRSPDGDTVRKYMTLARDEGRRDDAVTLLGNLYRETRHPPLWEVLHDTFTLPELDGFGPPETTMTSGPEPEPLLPRQPYRDVLPGVFAAPFASASSVLVLVVSGPLLLGATLALNTADLLGLAIAAFLLGYLVAFMFDILVQAAEGRERGPELKNLLWSDESRFEFVRHFARWLGAVAATYWPIVFIVSWIGRTFSESGEAILAIVSILITAWLPISLLQATFGNGFSAFNYPRAIERVRLLGTDYWICAGLFVVTTALSTGIQWAASAWVEGDEVLILGVRLVVDWITFASWMIQMRAVGLLCWARSDIRPA